MPLHNSEAFRASKFFQNLPEDFAFSGGIVEDRLMVEYGAMFAARGVRVPTSIVFRDEAEVAEFQDSCEILAARIGGFDLELQRPAMEALLSAIEAGRESGLSITPRGADSARRNYEGTVELWASRVEPALRHWTLSGRLAASEALEISAMPVFDQVLKVFELEEQGIFFAKDLSKSIIYSVAPPGTSQHLAMLAFDVSEFNDVRVRELLARHGWFQTVVSDLPHFTYLGLDEDLLATKGLRRINTGDRHFWVPDI